MGEDSNSTAVFGVGAVDVYRSGRQGQARFLEIDKLRIGQ